MVEAPIPADEAGRLAELHALGLLDTPREERFDRITRLLALVMKVPMAFLSLIDADRQWFKSTCGLGATETPREISFCGHTILSDRPMVVPDAAQDERFFDNPLVTGGPRIRFYAGQALNGPGGHSVGTLCVADTRPRTPSPDDLAALGELARLVERELGLMETVRLQRQLLATQQTLLRELSQAAAYVRSILPGPIEGPVRARWRFEPSSQLGGDFLGYDWIDADHFAAYVLDVSGHGVGSALLSASVASVLRGRSLPDTDFRDPAAVLSHLNDAFPMGRHDDMYFTIWYGVFDRVGRTLTFAGAGHPPALLLAGPAAGRPSPDRLGMGSFPIGIVPGAEYETGTIRLGPSCTLYVFSDGVYEIRRPDGSMMGPDELVAYLGSTPGPGDPDEVWSFLRGASGDKPLLDDFSLLELRFE